MKSRIYRSAAPLITRIQKLFSENLAKEGDFLLLENKILRSKLGKRVPLTETDRRTLVRYGLPLKDRLRAVISIVCPETLLGEGHLRHVVKQIEHHHNQQRPHQGLSNVVPLDFEYPDRPVPAGRVCSDTALGGRLNHYYAESVAA